MYVPDLENRYPMWGCEVASQTFRLHIHVNVEFFFAAIIVYHFDINIVIELLDNVIDSNFI